MNGKVVALYLRLSKEDDDDFQDESNSITSQREILTTYLRKQTELAEYQQLEFCDDGYSGVNFQRPKVQEMLSMVKEGLISCILVKDFSRFGRNYIEVGNYLEQVFPFLGVRFISVNDGFDSGKNPFSGDFFDVAFKNLVYDLYSKDLSEKVTSVRRTKAKKGKFITAYAPYGYVKSPQQKLVIDSEAAPIVQKIFQMALEGIPKAHIAKELNEKGIPTPLMLRKMRGEHFPCKCVGETCIWKASAISAILKDERYVGDAVYGKVKPTAIGSGKDWAVPKEQWIIVPETHDPIISREQFEKVRGMFSKRSNFQRRKQFPLSGLVRCASCNRAISRKKRTRRGGIQAAVYRCGIRNVAPGFCCYQKEIEESKIEDAILITLRQVSAILWDTESVEMVGRFNRAKIEQVEKSLIKYDMEISNLTRLRLSKYEAYKNGEISREMFLQIKRKFDLELEKLAGEKERGQKVLWECKCERGQEPASVTLRKKFAPFEVLTRKIALVFVKQVLICQDGSLRIEWNFRDFIEPKFFHLCGCVSRR